MRFDDYLAQFGEQPGYLDFARFGPPSHVVLRRREELFRQTVAAPPGTVDELMAAADLALPLLAGLLGTTTEHLVPQANASTGLLHAAMGAPAGTMLVGAAEFPANTYPWHRSAEAGGPRVHWLRPPDGRITPEVVRAALTPDTVGLSVSAVDARTGYLADLDGLRAVLGDRLLVVDGIQAFGALDLPWAAADVLAAGGQKWLRCGWGTGFLYCSARALERIRPVLGGWTGATDPVRYDDRLHPPAAGAARFSVTNLDPVAGAGLTAGLELLRGVGAAAVQAAITERREELAEAIRGAGGDPMLPADSARRSGILPFRVSGMDGPAIAAALAGQGVSATARPDHARLSVHASTAPEAAGLVRAAIGQGVRRTLR